MAYAVRASGRLRLVSAVRRGMLARSSLSNRPRGAERFASSSGSLGFRSLCAMSGPRAIRSCHSLGLRGDGEAPRRDKSPGGRDVVRRPLKLVSEPIKEPTCRVVPKTLFAPILHVLSKSVFPTRYALVRHPAPHYRCYRPSTTRVFHRTASARPSMKLSPQGGPADRVSADAADAVV